MMISNANRSGVVRTKRGEDRHKPRDDIRSGRSGDKPELTESKRLTLHRQKIIDVNGQRRLVDASN